MLEWIENWYRAQCDGEWEHECGIVIETLDNPGWQVKIDLRYTELEQVKIAYRLIENSENDWYGFSIQDDKFIGAGDPDALEMLLNKFRELAESVSSKTS